jgi:hypothetical protein
MALLNMCRLFLFFILAFSLCSISYGQDPGTSINIKLSNDGKDIADTAGPDYEILFRKAWTKRQDSLIKLDKRVDSNILPYQLYGKYKKWFSVFYWEPYEYQVLEITIIRF